MSEPTRYTAVGKGVVRTDPEGLLIAYHSYELLKVELKFAEHRMIALAEALADTRLGYQKKIEILKEKRSYLKRDQGSHKANNKGKPSRPGGKGEIIGDKPKESGGTY